MFQVNDMVLYGTNGVCRVVDIDERDCGGRMVEYYILKPIYASNSTVFVPVNNEKLTSKMRYVLTKEEIDAKIRAIPEVQEEWMDDEMLIEHREKVVARGKKLHVADERMLQEAEKMICDEFSYVLGIPKEEVPSYITNSMKESIH